MKVFAVTVTFLYCLYQQERMAAIAIAMVGRAITVHMRIKAEKKQWTKNVQKKSKKNQRDLKRLLHKNNNLMVHPNYFAFWVHQ